MYFLSIFLLVACGSKSTDTAETADTSTPTDTADTAPDDTDESNIFGNTFTLIETAGAAGTHSISLTFYSSGDSMSIGGLCNDLFGDVEFVDGVMNFTYGGSTDMECSDEESQESDWVIGFLEGSPLYEYDGSILELTGMDGILTFEKNASE